MKEEDLTELFIEELEELIEDFKILLPKLKRNLEDKEIIKNFSLIFHTIKGNSGVMGLQNLYQYCFVLESKLKRDNGINDKFFEMLIESVDTLENYLTKIKYEKLSDLTKLIVNQLEDNINQL
ncbi:MAG: Hpt domain-containing protein [Promethearchaeota archaeon]